MTFSRLKQSGSNTVECEKNSLYLNQAGYQAVNIILTPATTKTSPSIRRNPIGASRFAAIAVPIIAPISATPIKSGIFDGQLPPAERYPESPATELKRINAAAIGTEPLMSVQRNNNNSGLRKIPPPTPVNPDTKPNIPPTGIVIHSLGCS